MKWVGAMALMGLLASCGGATPAVVSTGQAEMTRQEMTKMTVGKASDSPISFTRIAAFPPPGWQIPRAAGLSPDGKLVTYLQSESGGEQMALFAFDVATGKHRVLLRAGDLVDPARKLSREEELRRERQRKRIKGVTSYQWARHANVMLLPLGGQVFVRTESGKIRQLSDAATTAVDPKICADGSKVAFVRGSELFVTDVKTSTERQLTHKAPAGVTRGLSDFNGQEEFGEASGFWWSPSCDAIAFLEVDESQVANVPVMGYREGADLQHLRYPRAGTDNPVVRLNIVALGSGKITSVQLPENKDFSAAEHYLGRLAWRHDGSALYLQRLTRSQQKVALVKVDPKTGAARHLVEESDPSWLEFSEVRALADGSLVWTALRNGHRHLERRDGESGALLNAITAGDWDVSQLVGIDAERGRVLFGANKDAVLDRQLYARDLAGKEPIVKLSHEPGSHAAYSRHPQHGWVDIHSAVDRLPKASIVAVDGQIIGEIPVPLDADHQALQLDTPELITLSEPGKVDLHGALLKPRNMDPNKRYPLVVMVYGGPGVQTIGNDYNPRLFWQHLADRGFVVWQLDNRGSTGRGHAFETPVRHRLGELELEDQLRGVAYLKSLPFVDAERVGIYGHSYGGYLSALAIMRAPEVFKVAVSGSPVTDWSLYDTGYTERYMGTPQNNAKGYAETAVLPSVDKLVGRLFIIHALMDENVHFEHTAKLIDALVEADKDFDLLVFPGERHGYRSPQARRYAYRRVADYFATNL